MPKENINIQVAYKLIDDGEFKEAEDLLLKLRISNYSPTIDYLLGSIHFFSVENPYYNRDKNRETFQGSKAEAKRYLRCAVDSKEPIENAFWRLAIVEENKKHSIRILKKGLQSFPNSEIIYKYLIRYSDNSNIPQIYKDIEEKDIKSNEIYFDLYKCFWETRNFKLALEAINKINLVEESEIQLLTLIKGFCFFELKKLKQAKNIFNHLIDEDVSQKLNYAQYIGILLCFKKLNKANEIIKFVEELPIKFDEEDFIYMHEYLNFSFREYFEDLLEELIMYLKENKKMINTYAKIRGIKAVRECEYENTNNKTLLDLKFARGNSINSDKEIYDTAIMQAYLNNSKVLEAYNQDFQNIQNYSGYETQLNWIIEKASNNEAKRIKEKFLKNLKLITPWDIKRFREAARYIIRYLYEDKNFKDILECSNHFSDEDLEYMEVLFEIAFASSKCNKEINAKKYYEMTWKKDKTYAVANNLALLYENEKDWDRAKKLYVKAIELNSEDTIAKENLNRLKNKIEDEIRNISESINIANIERLGFDDRLLSLLDSKISDNDFRNILKRDLRENVFALLTESYKTALVLSGSIIESFVLNKILSAGIKKFAYNEKAAKNGETKELTEMTIGEILYVAEKNKIIAVQLYHFSNALKQYRNLIHPGAEIRKGKMEKITKNDAEIAWTIVKKIINEI